MPPLFFLIAMALFYLLGGVLLLKHTSKHGLAWLLLTMGFFALVFAGILGLDRLAQLHRLAKADPKVAQVRFQMVKLQQGLRRYHGDLKNYPSTELGLTALFVSSGHSHWNGPYLETRNLFDPWNSPFSYNSDGEHYTLTSPGPDRKLGTPDDISLMDRD